ncbi:MAG: hypothetical protein M3Z01_07945 [Thermoproteota archaeon]|nr:hypothetical protein [Thermoproteota archaeon]
MTIWFDLLYDATITATVIDFFIVDESFNKPIAIITTHLSDPMTNMLLVLL